MRTERKDQWLGGEGSSFSTKDHDKKKTAGRREKGNRKREKEDEEDGGQRGRLRRGVFFSVDHNRNQRNPAKESERTSQSVSVKGSRGHPTRSSANAKGGRKGE